MTFNKNNLVQLLIISAKNVKKKKPSFPMQGITTMNLLAYLHLDTLYPLTFNMQYGYLLDRARGMKLICEICKAKKYR